MRFDVEWFIYMYEDREKPEQATLVPNFERELPLEITSFTIIQLVIERFVFDHTGKFQVWYEESMRNESQYKVCLSSEDCSCSNSLFYYTGIQHMMYFGVKSPYAYDKCDNL